MAPLAVHIKHAGKAYDVQLDPDLPPAVFKDAIYHLIGVPPERMKVMVKGGVLKDDTVWKKVGPKEGQTFMVIGAAGELPKPPAQAVVFLEDMDDMELAEALAKPVGLANMGNTCYMNATVQAMRAIPELQTALNASLPSGPLPRALSVLYNSMSRTTDSVVPMAFLRVLRTAVPQFGELDRTSKSGMGMGQQGYAQQDAEECWTQIVNQIKDVPGFTPENTPEAVGGKKFVEQFMMADMTRELKCDETEDEPATTVVEKVLKIECNISITTNYMLTGIMNSLDQKIEKRSELLGREAVYSLKSRLSRLPSYLTVHMVRFAWRRDIGKKAKIMRKVKFPLEFDALDLATPELKDQLLPVSRKLKEFEKERSERRKVRKRTKAVISSGVAAPKAADGDVEMADAGPSTSAEAEGGERAEGETATTTATEGEAPTTAVGNGKGKEIATGELEEESVYREKELKTLEELLSPAIKADVGCSLHGLYDLVAIVTHKGAAADAGHYMGFVKKSVFRQPPSTSSSSSAINTDPEDDEDWYKFDDEKVSVFPKEKLSTLDGGGEDSSAYVLLYKSKPLV